LGRRESNQSSMTTDDRHPQSSSSDGLYQDDDDDKKLHNSSTSDWFTERSVLWPGQAQSLQVEQVLFHQKSQFQVSCVYTKQCLD